MWPTGGVVRLVSEEPMVWCVLAQVFALLVDLLAMGRRSADEKDLEIVLLRHELRLLQRRQPAPPQLAPLPRAAPGPVPRLRLLHRRDALPPHYIRTVLHRAGHTARPHRRLHGQPDGGVGRAAGPPPELADPGRGAPRALPAP